MSSSGGSVQEYEMIYRRTSEPKELRYKHQELQQQKQTVRNRPTSSSGLSVCSEGSGFNKTRRRLEEKGPEILMVGRKQERFRSETFL